MASLQEKFAQREDVIVELRARMDEYERGERDRIDSIRAFALMTSSIHRLHHPWLNSCLDRISPAHSMHRTIRATSIAQHAYQTTPRHTANGANDVSHVTQHTSHTPLLTLPHLAA